MDATQEKKGIDISTMKSVYVDAYIDKDGNEIHQEYDPETYDFEKAKNIPGRKEIDWSKREN